MALYNSKLKPLEQGKGIRDYKHAARLFLDDNYRLSPKQTFLYYVQININQDFLNSLVGTGISSQGLTEQFESGMLVKAVELPKFTVDTKTLNAYNRKNINQNRINYDPVTITFHDDMADVVTNFWNDYYTYYYRDSDYDPSIYQMPSKYQSRQRISWGYSIRNQGLTPFIRDIQIFSLHQKRFTEYRLINPMITAWRHGEHRSSGANDIMENTMTVAYETVKYKTGFINPVDVNGFTILHYDNEPSPIATNTTDVYSSSGLLGAVAGGTRDLARPDGTLSGVGFLSSILSARRAYQNLKNVNLKNVAKSTIQQVGISILNGTVNGAVNGIFFPTMSGVATAGIATSGSVNLPGLSNINFGVPGIGGTVATSPYASPALSGAVTTGVQNPIATVLGQAVNTATGLTGQLFGVQPNNGTIQINPATGQPVTGSTTAVVIDDVTGQAIPGTQYRINVIGGGGYQSNDPAINAVKTQVTKDESGNEIIVRTYANGQQITFNSDNVPQSLTQNGQVYQANSNSGLIQVTDPRTGIVTTVGGSMTAQVTNSVSAGVGLAAGGIAGYTVGSKVSNLFGQSTGGRIAGGIAGSVAGAVTGKVVGTLVNNTTQTVINSAVGGVSQIYDNVSGSVKNVYGTFTGAGGPFGPSVNNAVSQITDPDTGYSTTVFKDGTTVVTAPPDENGDRAVVAQVDGSQLSGRVVPGSGDSGVVYTSTDDNTGVTISIFGDGSTLTTDAGGDGLTSSASIDMQSTTLGGSQNWFSSTANFFTTSAVPGDSTIYEPDYPILGSDSEGFAGPSDIVNVSFDVEDGDDSDWFA